MPKSVPRRLFADTKSNNERNMNRILLLAGISHYLQALHNPVASLLAANK